MPNIGPERKPPLVPDHELLRCIGSGSYGDVWLARNVMGTFRAVKIVYRQTFDHDRPYEREFNGMQKFEPVSRTHDGLVDILQVGRNDSAGYYYYVMELCDDVSSGQTIDPDHYEARTLASDLTRTTRLPFPDCLQIGLSVSAALDHLHRQGLVHRDIKPSNIIFVHGIPKIADIGLVAELGAPQSFVGTQGFIPPEGPGTPQADIYSLGKVLYEMSSGKDRQTYPELPTQLDAFGDQTDYLELNEVTLKACASDVRRRYARAQDMHADLLLLQAGKSVKRLRILEHRLAILMRLSLVGAALIVIGIFAHYQTWRAERRETQRLLEAYVAHATRSIAEGDLIGSLPWLAEALRKCAKAGVPEEPHRIRLSAVLEQCPRIVNLWIQPGAINHADFSPDGQRVVTALKLNRATLWDVAAGTRITEFIGHTNEVQMATFSPDGNRVLTASLDGTARLWDASTGKPLGLPLEHSAGLYSARFHPRDDRLITAGGDGTQGFVCLWERVGDSWHPEMLTTNSCAYRSATFSHDGSLIATACEDGGAMLWKHGSSWLSALTNHHGEDMWVYQHKFSPDDRYTASGSFDRRILVWDRQRNRLAIPPLNHRDVVHDLSFSPDGRHLLVACLDFTARLWDLETGRSLAVLRHTGNVTSASFSPEGRYIVTSGADGVTRIWDLGPLGWRPPPENRFFSGDGRVAVIATNQTLEISPPPASRSAAILIPTTQPILDIKLNHDGSRVFTFSSNSTSSLVEQLIVQPWDSIHSRPAAPAFNCDTNLLDALLSHNGDLFLSFSNSNAWILDALDGRRLLGPLTHGTDVAAGCFSPNGKRFATLAGNDVYLWDFPTGNLVALLPHESTASHAEFSPTGNLLITTCTDGGFEARSAQLWNANNGQAVGPPRYHRDGVLSASFSPDELRIVTASEDDTAAVWLLNSDRPVVILDHGEEVYQASFNHDGTWILTACRDGNIRVWQADNGDLLTPPLPGMPANSTWRASFVLDGRSVLASRKTGANSLVRLAPSTNTVGTITLTAQLLSGHQGNPTGSLFPLTTNLLWTTWTDLSRAGGPTGFAPPDDLRAWHLREAETCERKQLWFAALFHIDRLAALSPDDETLRHRRDNIRSYLDISSFQRADPFK
jgi:WD40 repeat protein